jgi:hypothetical protein
MEQNEVEIDIIKEKNFILISDKKIEYQIKFYINNNDLFCLTAFKQKFILQKNILFL